MALSPGRRLRIAAGQRYASAWRAACEALQRVAPASGRWWLRAPALPEAPLRREFGGGQGTPIDAFYARRFLTTHAADIHGRVLEAGTTGLAGVVAAQRIAALETRGGDDPLAADAFDCVVGVNVLVRATDPRSELAELHRSLRPGGVLLLVVPGLRQRRLAGVAQEPELWRLTSDGLQVLLDETFGAGQAAVETHGTIRSAAAMLYGMPEQLVPPAALQPPDPDFEIVVCGRAVKAA